MTAQNDVRPRVLVIDDEDAVRSMLLRALALWGYEGVPASSGNAAIDLLDGGERAEAVLLDLTMPGMTGEATLAAIQARLPGVPVALMSGYPREDLAAAGYRFLVKPFDLDSLKRLLEEMVPR
ncbi:response regulator [Tepidiforma sp.]|uniref:response regulator n=1 Tax=Tepidiforma sp. TaxID=2682230 RepID=UPI002ADD9508|nr:response regulator [Tepidiforma sp.]